MVKAAKKRKREEDEAFELPEFDQVAYMKKEMQAARAAFVLIALAALVAILLYGITIAGAPIVAFFVGLGVTFFLPRIFRLLPWPKVDVSKFERRDWIGHGGAFFFSWLAFWILILNVPFVDVTPPVISGVYVANSEGVRAFVVASPGQGPGLAIGNGTFWINATIHENSGTVFVEYTVDAAARAPTRDPDRPVYVLETTLTGGQHEVTILARDAAGNEAQFSFRIVVS